MTRLKSSVLALLLVAGAGACSKKEAAQEASAPAPAAAEPAFTPGEMVLIPAGEFTFGDNEKDSSFYPQQKISLPAFWIDKFEVTNREYLDFSINGNYVTEGQNWRLFFSPQKVDYPVVNITWNDAAAFCKWKGKRLPTEQEWEKAARGTDGRRYPWGEKWETNRSNTYEAGMRAPAAVNTFNDVSPYEVHDMMGNVQEWTADWYKGYKGNPKKDKYFGEQYRVLRGASSSIYGSKAHLWDRSAYLPKSLYGFGCRCAKDAAPGDAEKAKAK